MCQPLALACWSQTTEISCKGAKTLGSEPLKPVIDAPTYTYTSTHALCLWRGWHLPRETELFGRGSHIPEQGRERARRHWISFNKYLVRTCAMGRTLHEVPGTGPWTVCGSCPAEAAG